MKKGFRTLGEVTLLLAIVTLITQLIFCYVLKREHYVSYSVIIPIFFFLSGVVLSFFVGKHWNRKESPSFASLTLLRTAKIVIGLIVLVIGIVLDKSYALFFTGEFVVYYIAYLCYDTYMLFNLNKKANINAKQVKLETDEK